jgi:diazepam-binding inhibitor (GABA receptor modulating acyl-CoA-binding protein)
MKLISTIILSLLVATGECNELFNEAAAYVSSSAPLPASNATKLRVYGLYAQAIRGDCPDSHNDQDEVARMKREAWCKNRGMSADVAMQLYVSLIDELVPEWRS